MCGLPSGNFSFQIRSKAHAQKLSFFHMIVGVKNHLSIEELTHINSNLTKSVNKQTSLIQKF